MFFEEAQQYIVQLERQHLKGFLSISSLTSILGELGVEECLKKIILRKLSRAVFVKFLYIIVVCLIIQAWQFGFSAQIHGKRDKRK